MRGLPEDFLDRLEADDEPAAAQAAPAPPQNRAKTAKRSAAAVKAETKPATKPARKPQGQPRRKSRRRSQAAAEGLPEGRTRLPGLMVSAALLERARRVVAATPQSTLTGLIETALEQVVTAHERAHGGTFPPIARGSLRPGRPVGS